MKVTVKSDRCKQCELCVTHCPQQAIKFTEEFNAFGYKTVVVDDEKCIACGICYTMCPDGVYEVLK